MVPGGTRSDAGFRGLDASSLPLDLLHRMFCSLTSTKADFLGRQGTGSTTHFAWLYTSLGLGFTPGKGRGRCVVWHYRLKDKKAQVSV